MQIIYRVKIDIRYIAIFDFNNIEQACKFADAAKITNVDGEDGKAKVTIELLTKEEIENDD